MSVPVTLDGPHFNTINWDKDHSGVHPVEMLARIAKFENKAEAKYEVCRRPVNNREPGNEYKKLVVCCYDNFMTYGNGKLEKQAKLVSARNMICKIRTQNIGIVNETLAAGVTIEKTVDTDPYKKPIVRQFKSFTAGGSLSTMSSFKSAGTLGSFVPSSGSLTSQPTSDIVKPPVSSSGISQTDKEEIEQYRAYIEGKVESPTERLPIRDQETDETKSESTVSEPKIVFKRSAESERHSIEQPDNKKTKGNDREEDWDSSNYGYHQHYSHQRGRGRCYNGGNNRGARGYGGGHWY